MPDVIAVRNEILPAGEREINVASDLNDYSWMDKIDAIEGAVFYGAGVFYYFRREDVKRLLFTMAKRFPGSVITFDSCNRHGAKLMTKTWLKEAGIKDVNAFFSIEDKSEIESWNKAFKVTAKSYMRGYRDIYKEVGGLHKLMIRFCDSFVKMQIIKIVFE